MAMTLLDWRRRVAAMYAEVRASAGRDPEGTLERFRRERDRLFRDHPQTPLAAGARAGFGGIPYSHHAPAMRFASCAYDPRWSCPLAPRANHPAVPVRSGERL